MPYVPSCLPCWRALVPSCPRAQIFSVPSCLLCWRALVPSCPRAQISGVPSCHQCWRALVPSCPRARVPKFLACPRAFDSGVLSRLNFRPALVPSMLMFRTLLRDLTLETFLESLKLSDPFFLNFIRTRDGI